MKLEKIHLFCILLLSLLICCCLGSDSSRTSIFEGMSGATIEGDKGKATVVKTPGGQTVVATQKNTVDGVSSSDIPSGQEDLYILKSEIVPPVCPVCPSPSVCPREKPCNPCPPCARCPDPAFECKKVPNYNSIDDSYLPLPMLNDFSAF